MIFMLSQSSEHTFTVNCSLSQTEIAVFATPHKKFVRLWHEIRLVELTLGDGELNAKVCTFEVVLQLKQFLSSIQTGICNGLTFPSFFHLSFSTSCSNLLFFLSKVKQTFGWPSIQNHACNTILKSHDSGFWDQGKKEQRTETKSWITFDEVIFTLFSCLTNSYTPIFSSVPTIPIVLKPLTSLLE